VRLRVWLARRGDVLYPSVQQFGDRRVAGDGTMSGLDLDSEPRPLDLGLPFGPSERFRRLDRPGSVQPDVDSEPPAPWGYAGALCLELSSRRRSSPLS
jgi:hypothetical protein